MTTKILTAEHDDVINRVAYPSLANANLVFFKSSYYNVEVVPKDGESEEQLVNDFKRSCFRAGVLQESRRRRFFESSLEKKTRKTKEAAKKYRKRDPQAQQKCIQRRRTRRSLGTSS
jgi:ribosomal protein S21